MIRRLTKFKTLEEWAESKPSLGDIEEIANCLAADYAEGDGLNLFQFAMQDPSARDQVHENTLRTHNYLLLYEELSYAMNAGDIGRIETLLTAWIPIFCMTGKHKYGTRTLRFFHALYFVYPERLRSVQIRE